MRPTRGAGWTCRKGGARLWARRPVWGLGLGFFGAAFSTHIERAKTTVSHTEPVTVAAEQGGRPDRDLALVVLALAVLFTGASVDAATAATTACFVAMVVHSLGYAAFTIDPATWALLGLWVALRRAGPSPRRALTSAAAPAVARPPEPLVRRPSPRWFGRGSRVMFEYLRRLATTGAAYTASSRRGLEADRGLPLARLHALSDAERLRRGGGDALVGDRREHHRAVRDHRGDPSVLRPRGERPARVVSTGFAALFWARRSPPRRSRCRSPGRSRRPCFATRMPAGVFGDLGLWNDHVRASPCCVSTSERARIGITVANVLLTIPFTVWLIVVEGERANGILLEPSGLAPCSRSGCVVRAGSP